MNLVKNISKILYIGFFLNNADAALPIYPGEILGRDLAYPGVEWLGHVGISLGTQIREQAVGVMEVLNEPKVIQLNSIPDFKSRSRYWGSRYGIAPLDQPFSILRTGLRQRNYCPEYTLLPSWHPGKMDGDKRICGKFRCDTFINYIFYANGHILPTFNSISSTPRKVYAAFPYSNGDLSVTKSKKKIQDIELDNINTLSYQDIYQKLQEMTNDKDILNSIKAEEIYSLTKVENLSIDKKALLLEFLGNFAKENLITNLTSDFANEENYFIKKSILLALKTYDKKHIAKTNLDLLQDFYLKSMLAPKNYNVFTSIINNYLALFSEKLTSSQTNELVVLIQSLPKQEEGRIDSLISVLLATKDDFTRIIKNISEEELFQKSTDAKLMVYTNLIDYLYNNYPNSSSKQTINDNLIKNNLENIQDLKTEDFLAKGAWLELNAITSVKNENEIASFILQFLEQKDPMTKIKFIAGLSDNNQIQEIYLDSKLRESVLSVNELEADEFSEMITYVKSLF